MLTEGFRDWGCMGRWGRFRMLVLVGLAAAGCKESPPSTSDGTISHLDGPLTPPDAISDRGADLDSAGANKPWAVAAGGTGNISSTGIAHDSAGNTYIAGTFTGAVTLGSSKLLSTAKSADFLVAKLSPEGKFLWITTSTNSPGLDSAGSIVVDRQGNSYILGVFNGSPTLGTTSLKQCGSSNETFIAKLNPSGKFLEAWRIGCTSTGVVVQKDLALDGTGDLILVGSYSGTLSFGQKTLPRRGGYDIFIVKLDSSGKTKWVTSAGGAGSDDAEGGGVDKAGNIFVAGSYSKTATFGSTTLKAGGMAAAFVAKLDKSGAFLWTASTTSQAMAMAWDITVDAHGTPLIAGVYSNSVSFGSRTLKARGGNDIFIAKLDTKGTFTWAATAGGAQTLDPWADSAYAIAVDASGKSYITGHYEANADFGSTSLSAGASPGPAYVAALSPNGVFQWATSTGASGEAYGHAIAVDGHGRSTIVGRCSGTTRFGSASLDCGTSFWKLFVARLDQNGKF